jgi:hypothetical protein
LFLKAHNNPGGACARPVAGRRLFPSFTPFAGIRLKLLQSDVVFD